MTWENGCAGPAMACLPNPRPLLAPGRPITPSAPSQRLERVFTAGVFVPYHHRLANPSFLNERRPPPSWSCCKFAVHAAGPPRWPAHGAPAACCRFCRVAPALPFLLAICPGPLVVAGPSLFGICWGSIPPLVLIPFAGDSRPVGESGWLERSRLPNRCPASTRLFLVVSVAVVASASAHLPGQHPEPAYSATSSVCSWLDLGPESRPCCSTALAYLASPAATDPAHHR